MDKREQMQKLAQAFICRLLINAVADLQICALKGWNIEEYTKCLSIEVEKIARKLDNV